MSTTEGVLIPFFWLIQWYADEKGNLFPFVCFREHTDMIDVSRN